ncbi:MAG TPA: hypothetical protein VD884_12240 [Ohtaekwangia sp.]|nr:hypothetical protein [Ohtaekwangia sp.]
MKLALLKYKTNRLLKKVKAPHSSVPYEKARTIGIVFTAEDKQKHFAIKEFIKRLETAGKHVQVLEFLPENTENFEFKFDFFTDKDVFWGTIISPSAIQFAEAPLDYLFCLDVEPNPYILNLLARSPAKCRVGRYWEEGKLYLDFMIESVNTTSGLLESIHKYITQIR